MLQLVCGSDVDRGWPAAGLLRPVDPGSSLHHQSLSARPSHALGCSHHAMQNGRSKLYSCLEVLVKRMHGRHCMFRADYWIPFAVSRV